MKVQYKIYIGDYEYIRKDSLIKWAEKMIAGDKNRGIKGGFYMLIDKLNGNETE